MTDAPGDIGDRSQCDIDTDALLEGALDDAFEDLQTEIASQLEDGDPTEFCDITNTTATCSFDFNTFGADSLEEICTDGTITSLFCCRAAFYPAGSHSRILPVIENAFSFYHSWRAVLPVTRRLFLDL